MKFKDLSEWTTVHGHCAARYKIGGDVNNPTDVIAFIEKVPGVRVDMELSLIIMIPVFCYKKMTHGYLDLKTVSMVLPKRAGIGVTKC